MRDPKLLRIASNFAFLSQILLSRPSATIVTFPAIFESRADPQEPDARQVDPKMLSLAPHGAERFSQVIEKIIRQVYNKSIISDLRHIFVVAASQESNARETAPAGLRNLPQEALKVIDVVVCASVCLSKIKMETGNWEKLLKIVRVIAAIVQAVCGH